MDLETLLEQNRTIRVIGFDDAPFIRCATQPVPVAGVVCAGTRFEGMVWGQVTPDGWDATEVLCDLLLPSKFLTQVYLVLLDGISFSLSPNGSSICCAVEPSSASGSEAWGRAKS
jgi:endonuclease V-like protein UPF0215 family